MRKYLTSGISEIYIDLILTLIVISVSGALLSGVLGITKNVHNNVGDVSLPLVYALMVNSSSEYLVILCNYGSRSVNFTILANDSTVIYHASVAPNSFTVVKLSSAYVNRSSLGILVNNDVIIRPLVINV